MPLTKQQLLIPRVLCIGTKEGEPNDTSGDFITGDILTQTVKSIHKWKSEKLKHSVYFCDKWIEQFPHLFKPLPWWEKRSASEMPDYVKDNNGVVHKVEKLITKDGNSWSTVSGDIEPADESEYQEYQKQKEAK